MAGDWRISADECGRYETFFQQCGPIQGYLSGEQARDFFVKSNLPGDILRKIWDLADVTSDGRLDVREFIIACHLISSQVQNKVPLPITLPASLLSDSGIATNGTQNVTKMPLAINASNQPSLSSQFTGLGVKPTGPANTPITPLTPVIRSKYLQQFHSIVDVAKSNGLMSGLQAKTILQQTNLSNIILHQIWNLADYDKDGCLTPDEFVVAMHCCDIARSGQPLPTTFPDQWLQNAIAQQEQINPLAKRNDTPSFSSLNQQLKEVSNAANESEAAQNERKIALATYEEKRLRNYEDGNRELERRRQLLREQEEREQKEREERERKRELELQKQKDEQERKKQAEIERQLEKQRQIEQQKEEERRKLFEQREAARKEMERKSRLEWERQRMQELSSQKTRLLDQINDLKSREKAFELESESMDDNIQTCQTKISQVETNIHSMDESIADIQRNIMTERSLYDNAEQQMKDLKMQLNNVQAERESLDSALNEIVQSIEFSKSNREVDYIKNFQTQIETMKQENTQVDEQILTITDQCKEYQNQIEQHRLQFEQIEKEVNDKVLINKPPSPINQPADFANFDQFNANMPANDFNAPSSDPFFPPSSVPVAVSPPLPTVMVDVDPFQTVDPFATQAVITSTVTNNDWIVPSKEDQPSATVDPFLPKIEPVETPAVVASPKLKKAAPRIKAAPKPPAHADPWGESTTKHNNGTDWVPFKNDSTNTNSPFGTTTEWPTPTTGSIQYRVLYDYVPERSDEMAITSGEIVTVDPSKQQDDNWLFGQIGNDRQGFFPAVYVECIASTTPSTVVDTTSQLSSGSWVLALADCQGKTADKHLSFQKGELILVREQKDAIWYSGQLNGKIGWFPRNYVRPASDAEIENNKTSATNPPVTEHPLKSPTSNDKSTNNAENGNVYEAIYAYDATDPSDLSFDVGHRITVLTRDGDWWTGRIGDRTGLFPSNYVQKVETVQETAIAIAPFQSTDEDRLSFEKDQLIYIINKDNKGWYQGEIRMPDQPVRTGWFPAESVQIQEAAPLNSPSASAANANASKVLQYIAIFPYEAQQDDELSFPADVVLEILDEAHSSGWFKARLGEQIGLIPSTYVHPIDAQQPSSSTGDQPFPIIMSHTPPTTPSSQQPSSNDSITLTNNTSSRISAIRELVETEQRYVNDLRLVANEFIRPLTTRRTLNDYETEQLFGNWFSLIACNSVFLSTLQEQVQYREILSNRELGPISMPNTEQGKQDDRSHGSLAHPIYDTPPVRPLRDHVLNEHNDRLLSTDNESATGGINIEQSDDNIVPQSSYSSSSMTINESTRLGEILCSYLPYMADVYFQYCNCHSRANKYLQSKIESNEQFRSNLDDFQKITGGLSLNGFLTKPIQRVTRYPLLIEKILKHTAENHPDYRHINQAYESARELNHRINKQIFDQENNSRLDWLQNHLILSSDESPLDGYLFDELFKFNSITKLHLPRQLLFHGFLMKVPRGRDLLGFLFNDFILFSTIKLSSSHWQSQLFEAKSNLQLKLYRLPILMNDIISASEQPDDKLTFSITTRVHEKPLLLKVKQTNIRTLWVRSINNALEEYRAIEKSMLADKALFTISDNNNCSKTPIASLLLIVLEACDLTPSTAAFERHLSLCPYCEITLGSLTCKTPFANRTNNPKWNTSMQFFIYDFQEDIMHINIFDNEFFSPNENIGSTSFHFADILPMPLDIFIKELSRTFRQTVYLNNGATVILECSIQFLL